MTFFTRIVLLLCLSFISLPDKASAQAAALLGSSGSSTAAAPELPDPLTPEAIRELVAHMSDDQVRDMLLDRLDAVAEAKDAPQARKGLLVNAQKNWTAFYESNMAAISKLPILLSRQGDAFATFAGLFKGMEMLILFGIMALSLVAGFIAEKIVNTLTQRWQGKETAAADSSLGSTLSFLFRRFMREILGLVAFFLVVRTILLALLGPDELAFVGPFMTYLIWFPRIGAAFLRLLLAPKRSDLRLVSVNDRWASFLYHHDVGLILLGGFSVFIVGFNVAMGVAMGETRLGFWLSTAVHIYIVYIAWTAREGLTDMMRGSDPDRTGFDEIVAKAYPYFAIVVSAGMWVIVNIIAGLGKFALLLNSPHYKTMFWLLSAPIIDTAIRGTVRYLAPPMVGEGVIAETAYRATKRSYIRIGRVIAGIIVVLMIANAWEIDLRNLAAAGVGQNFASNIIEFFMISAVGYVIYELVSLWINRKLAKEQTTQEVSEDAAAGEGGGAGGSRLTTVLPLVRISAQVAIGVIFSLVALGALGIDTTPLLAGAGILGLAIGFGAQKLVADIVSGVFFLIDDAFRVGEYVDVGGTMGTVEKISIRSMQLRHHRGLVHTVPYGEIPKLTNFSRDWVIMKLKFTVPFDTNPNQIKKIFKKIGAEMLEDPLFNEGFIEPFKSQGVFDFDDVGMVIRGKFMAKPGTQFTIRKEIYNRVKAEFDAADIPFARREVRVAIPGLEHHEDLSDEEKVKVAATAAAAEAARQQAQMQAEKP